jgi:hypothetical protein
MTDDAFAQPAAQPVQSGRTPTVRNGRYRFWNPETETFDTWSRVSTFAKAIDDTKALTDWLVRQAVIGIGIRPDLHALAASLDPDDYRAGMDIAKQAQDAAGARTGANKGTALHAFAEAVDRGDDISHAPEAWRKDAFAYAAALKEARLEPVPDLMERTVMIPDLKLVGRFDRVYRHVPTGRLLIGDLKTTVKIDYTWGQIAVQEAAYAHAAAYWDVERDEWIPMPALDLSIGVVAHVLVGTGQATMRLVDIERGWAGAQLASGVRAYRSGARSLQLPLERLTGNADTPLARIGRAVSREELSAIWQELYPRSEWTTELQAAGMRRSAELALHS